MFCKSTIKIRELAKSIIGDENFIEIYVNASLNDCEKRDVKGLYAKARAGEIKNFTGIDAPFEAPIDPSLEVNTSDLTIDASIQRVIDYILQEQNKTINAVL